MCSAGGEELPRLGDAGERAGAAPLELPTRPRLLVDVDEVAGTLSRARERKVRARLRGPRRESGDLTRLRDQRGGEPALQFQHGAGVPSVAGHRPTEVVDAA